MTRPLRMALWAALAVVAAWTLSPGRQTWAPRAAAAGSGANAPATQPAPDAPVITQGRQTPWPGWISGAHVALIEIHGVIDDYTVASLEKRCDRAARGGAALIVFDINTPGGEAPSALRISRMIKNLPVPTLAWIHDEAYSAGTLIAVACTGIIMAPVSVMGDCAPIVPGANLLPTERAKALSPILAEFDDSAIRGDYPFVVFHAMCELGVSVYEVRHGRTGQTRLVNQADYAVLVKGEALDEVRDKARARVTAPPASGVTPGGPSGPASPAVPAPPSGGSGGAGGTGGSGGAGGAGGSGAAPAKPAMPPLPPMPNKPVMPTVAAGSTLTPEDLGGFMPSPQTRDEDRGTWTVVRQVHDGRGLLTVHQRLAGELGLIRGTVKDRDELKKYLAAASVTVVDLAVAEGATYWLTRPWVRAICVALLVVGIIIEMQAPGHMIGAAIAAIAVIVLLVAPYLIGLAQLWHLLLFVVGAVLLAIELFAPTFGVLGVVGLLMMFVGLVMAVIPTGGGGPLAVPPDQLWFRVRDSIAVTSLGILGGAIVAFYVSRNLQRLPVANRMILKSRSPLLIPGMPPAPVSGEEALGSGRIAAGHKGQAVCQLRPSGRARIGAQVVDVQTQGDWIDAGQPVKVLEVSGNRIVVAADDTDQAPG